MTNPTSEPLTFYTLVDWDLMQSSVRTVITYEALDGTFTEVVIKDRKAKQ